MNSQEFWLRVGELRDSLPPQEYFIMYSLDASARGYKGGSMTEVDRTDAARLIAIGSHRLATEAEVAENTLAIEARRKEYEARELHRLQNSGLRVVVQSPSIAEVKPAADSTSQGEPTKAADVKPTKEPPGKSQK